MEHTKGPWEVTYDGNWTITGEDFTICHDNIDDHERRPEESFANAQLITSAPELLVACKKLRLACSDDENDYPDSQLYRIVMDACETAEAAINKAEGR